MYIYIKNTSIWFVISLRRASVYLVRGSQPTVMTILPSFFFKEALIFLLFKICFGFKYFTVIIALSFRSLPLMKLLRLHLILTSDFDAYIQSQARLRFPMLQIVPDRPSTNLYIKCRCICSAIQAFYWYAQRFFSIFRYLDSFKKVTQRNHQCWANKQTYHSRHLDYIICWVINRHIRNCASNISRSISTRLIGEGVGQIVLESFRLQLPGSHRQCLR